MFFFFSSCDEQRLCGDVESNLVIEEIASSLSESNLLYISYYQAVGFCTNTDERPYTSFLRTVDLETYEINEEYQPSEEGRGLPVPEKTSPLFYGELDLFNSSAQSIAAIDTTYSVSIAIDSMGDFIYLSLDSAGISIINLLQ